MTRHKPDRELWKFNNCIYCVSKYNSHLNRLHTTTIHKAKTSQSEGIISEDFSCWFSKTKTQMMLPLSQLIQSFYMGSNSGGRRRLQQILLAYCIIFNYALLCVGHYMRSGEGKSMNYICRLEGKDFHKTDTFCSFVQMI